PERSCRPRHGMGVGTACPLGDLAGLRGHRAFGSRPEDCAVSRTDDANGTADQAVGTRSGVPTGRLHVRFAADPASVPGARRFVVDGLHAWGLDELADDAALCISELASNAALHSVSTFMRVEVWRSGDVVRMSVEDDGDERPAVVVPRADYGPDGRSQSHQLESEPTTGRGLA